ncbi:GNAT family N-acetyltransferase [Bacillus sp. E214]|nr:GNAT family N-acetyltransferase [Bacillus sp. E214]
MGFGRALSDGVFNGAIYDLVVHTDEQGNGVAKEIINSLLTQLNPYLVST